MNLWHSKAKPSIDHVQHKTISKPGSLNLVHALKQTMIHDQEGQTDVPPQMLDYGRQSGKHENVAEETETRLEPIPLDINELAALIKKGQYPAAAEIARNITARFPLNGVGWKALGIAFKQMGRTADALTCKLKAAELSPNDSDAHYNLGNGFNDSGEFDKALASFRRALALAPGFSDAYYNIGTTFKHLRYFDKALSSYRRTLDIRPDYPEGLINLGGTLHELGQLDEAELTYRRLLELKPDYLEAQSNLGLTLHDLGRFEEAAACYRQALGANPSEAKVLSNLGVTLRYLGTLNEAEVSYRRALQIRPDFAQAKYNLGCLLLCLGRYDEGWSLYESRNDSKTINSSPPPPGMSLRQWHGQDLTGKTLLVWHEQGLGDQIQFCRYLPMLKARGPSHITLVCQAQLKSLFQRFVGADEVLTIAEVGLAPTHDWWTFPLSLPLQFNTRLGNIPATLPYLHADERLQREISMQHTNIAELKVGICWKGSMTYKEDACRSPGLGPFKKLFYLSGVRFFNLQVGGRTEFLAAAGAAAQDLGHEIDTLTGPFEETAALIMNLDLIITCDTSIGHLAGALGKTVWVLLPFVSDWRWMTEREDSPWYPNTQLFRQIRRGDWEELFTRVAHRLISVISEKSTLWPVTTN